MVIGIEEQHGLMIKKSVLDWVWDETAVASLQIMKQRRLARSCDNYNLSLCASSELKRGEMFYNLFQVFLSLISDAKL